MHRHTRFTGLFVAILASWMAASQAQANSELLMAHDARSGGMAATGTAFINNAAAASHNPANLGDVKFLTATLSFSPDVATITAPIFAGPGASLQLSTDPMLVPYGLAGLAIRVHKHIVVGAAALITSAAGATFPRFPTAAINTKAGAIAPTGRLVLGNINWETRLPVAINITDWLSVSAAWRAVFTQFFAEFDLNGQPLSKAKEFGYDLGGVQAGIAFKPHTHARFGLEYRSRTSVTASGTRSVYNPITHSPLTSTTENETLVVPHQFSAGAAIYALERRLLLAADFKYWMFADAYPGVMQDAYSGHVGAEYTLAGFVPVRAGYLIGRSSIKDKLASFTTTSPGIQQGATVGLGVKFAQFSIDGMFGVGLAGGDIGDNPVPGRYALTAWVSGLSASFDI